VSYRDRGGLKREGVVAAAPRRVRGRGKIGIN